MSAMANFFPDTSFSGSKTTLKLLLPEIPHPENPSNRTKRSKKNLNVLINSGWTLLFHKDKNLCLKDRKLFKCRKKSRISVQFRKKKSGKPSETVRDSS
jgi:hypothetical protein